MPAQRTAGLGNVDPHALVLECNILNQEVRVQINYDSRIMKKEKVETLLQHSDHVLRQVCAGDRTTKVEDGVLSEPDLHHVWKRNVTVPTA